MKQYFAGAAKKLEADTAVNEAVDADFPSLSDALHMSRGVKPKPRTKRDQEKHGSFCQTQSEGQRRTLQDDRVGNREAV